MSLAALALATRDTIQTVTGLDANSCEVGFDGQPKPGAGQVYYAIHCPGWNGISGDFDLHESYQVAVTITLRMGWAPQDRWGIEVWLAANTGLDALVRQVIVACHKNYKLINSANAGKDYSIGVGSAGFVTPLWFLSAGAVQLKGAKWFSAEDAPPKNGVQTAQSGVAQEIRFGKAERCQAIDTTES
jgi:hypothetical protein